MFRPKALLASKNDSRIDGTLPVLPLPAASVLLPSSTLAVQLFRQDSLNMLEAVLAEADSKGSTSNAIVAAAPFRLPAAASRAVAGSSSPSSPKGGASSPPASPAPMPLTTAVVHTTSGDGVKPSVNQLSEYACAARIIRVEKLEVQINGKQDNGYLVILEGICRLRIDRFTMTGTPYFEAQVTAFPRKTASEDPVNEDLVARLRIAAQTILESLEAALSPFGKGKLGNKKLINLPNVAPKLSEFALKSLRASINRLNASTADELSDVLVSSLLPSSKPASFPVKLHHLSLLVAGQRVEHAAQQLEILNAGLKAKEGVEGRFNRSELRKAREGVLKGLLDAIIQELRALKKEEADDLGIPSSPPGVGPPRMIRNGNQPGHSHGNGTASADEEEEEDEEVDELQALKQKIKDSTMPEETLKLCLKEWKRLEQIPPMSPEYGKSRDYLDWMISLPWSKSTFDLPNSSKIDRDFLERARKQLQDDHFGIDKVKVRLLQYLAVLRLKHEQWEEEENALRVQETQEAKDRIQAGDEDEQKDQNSKAVVLRSDPLSTRSQDLNVNGEAVSPDPQPSNPSAPSKRKTRQFRDKGPILCLVGPPGVGKTSIARSLATAMGRPFSRAALGGISDESEIRGFRRTYVGSMPGMFIQKLRQVGVNNPVILLDEIDKLSGGSSTRGDPAAAMLEVLDPEQNYTFTDHYINTPVDLSSVLFIATANSLDTIPAPLLDRMEIINLSGYVDTEKLQIARKYLLPKQLKANSLQPEHVKINDDTLLAIVNRYCGYESGVRTLERQIGSVCRWKAVELARARDQLYSSLTTASIQPVATLHVDGYDPTVRTEDLETILGHNYKKDDELETVGRPGAAVGLGYTGSGTGCILHVEATSMPGRGELRLTGSLGDVIKESAVIALSWLKANAFNLGLAERDQNIMEGIDIHLHLPEGGIKKDGPSAGVAMTMCLLSLFSGQAMDPRLAMTGEITLRGKIGAVGGIKEKCLAAARAGVKHLMLPEACRSTAMADLPQKIRDEIEIAFVDNIWQAIEYAFPTRSWNLPGPNQSASKPVARFLNKL